MLEIIFQDQYLCVVNKAPGQVVHKTRGAGDSPIILQSLRDQIGQYVYPLHRLDRGTSGCLAFALGSDTARKFQTELQSDSAIKKYTALCRGKLQPEGVFDRPLSNENKVKQQAFTKYRVLQEYEEVSLLDIHLLTGRRHQIRRHLSFAGHHIVGDIRYGKGWLNRRFRDLANFHRMFLHCHFLSFLHPITGQRLNLHSELGDDLKELITHLEADQINQIRR